MVDCEDCSVEEGIWEIIIRKEYRGSYGKKVGLLCDQCLIHAIVGYHSGGGLTSDCIQKIIRRAG